MFHRRRKANRTSLNECDLAHLSSGKISEAVCHRRRKTRV
jgi:hypothetical protein